MSVLTQGLSSIQRKLELAGTIQAAKGYYGTREANRELSFYEKASAVERVDVINQKYNAGLDVSRDLEVHSTLETGIAPSSSYLHPDLRGQNSQLGQQQPQDLATIIREGQQASKEANDRLYRKMEENRKADRKWMSKQLEGYQKKRGRKK